MGRLEEVGRLQSSQLDKKPNNDEKSVLEASSALERPITKQYESKLRSQRNSNFQRSYTGHTRFNRNMAPVKCK